MKTGKAFARGVAPVLAVAVAGRAEAHAFDAGADAYNQVVEGITVVLIYPGLLLPLMALGVLLALWRTEGLPEVWPIFLLAQVAGVILGAFVGPWIGFAAMGVGIAAAALAALMGRPPVWAAYALAGLGGLSIMAAAFEGHALLELTVWIHIGLLFGANMVLAMSAGFARLLLERVAAPWMRIGWRVVGSWIGAILLLVLAFAARTPVA